MGRVGPVQYRTYPTHLGLRIRVSVPQPHLQNACGCDSVGVPGTEQSPAIRQYPLLQDDGLNGATRLPVGGGEVRPGVEGAGVLGAKQPLTVGGKGVPVGGHGGVQVRVGQASCQKTGCGMA